MKYLCFLLLSFSLFLACSKPSELEQALEIAGDNRNELEKVLERYRINPVDSLKYKAACFLIENMPGYYYYEGEYLEKYAEYFKLLGESSSQPVEILDSLSNVYGPFNRSYLEMKQDIEEIDSAYLCENIDLAFKVWTEKPWCKDVSFEDFCENILPYRIGNEKLTYWRKNYLEEYSPLIENLDIKDPIEVSIILRHRILEEMWPKKFTTKNPPGYPSLDAYTAKNLTGSCDNMNQFVVFLLRSVGIPCSIDYMPIRGDQNIGHSWVSLKNNKHEYYTIDYFGDAAYISGTELNHRSIKSKVYRKTFSRNSIDYNRLSRKTESIPATYTKYNYRFYDVTPLYSNGLMDLSIPKSMIYKDKFISNAVFYLCTPCRLSWVPVAWTDIYKKGAILFKDVEAGCTFRVAQYENNQFTYITDPFTMHNQTKEIKVYTQGIKADTLVLYSKYSLESENEFRDRMIGGVFEGADNPTFENPDTLHIIKNRPYRLFHNVDVFSDKAYRYVRYKGPKFSNCNVSEIQFFSDTLLLKGKVIGTPGCWQNDGSHEYTNAFDGTTETSFDHNTSDDGWTGMDLGQPFMISQIIYSPRNNDNYIKRGNKYELFISDREGWKSLGYQIASADSLRYENAFDSGLFYLKNHTGGNQERPFTMEKGKSIFL